MVGLSRDHASFQQNTGDSAFVVLVAVVGLLRVAMAIARSSVFNCNPTSAFGILRDRTCLNRADERGQHNGSDKV